MLLQPRAVSIPFQHFDGPGPGVRASIPARYRRLFGQLPRKSGRNGAFDRRNLGKVQCDMRETPDIGRELS